MDYSRQTNYFKNELFNEQIHIIGAGATGSWVALALAKMGVKHIHVWDFDVVEVHNIPNQAFPLSAVGSSKVDAAYDLCSHFSETDIIVHNERVDGTQRLMGVVFMLTDSMSSRKQIYEAAVKNKPLVKLLIETRMAGNGGFIYTLDPSNQVLQNNYEQTLYDDSVSEESLCGTSISVLPTGLQIVGAAIWQFVNYANKHAVENCISISSENGFSMAERWS